MQKDTVELIINSDGLTCTTTNPFGSEPNPMDYATDQFEMDKSKWQQAENDRITYEIDSCEKQCKCRNYDSRFPCNTSGTIHKARIENGKATII